MQVQDRDVTRILWPSDPLNQDEPRIYRFTRVTFGLGPAPFLLGATIQYHLSQSDSRWASALENGSYVDNYVVPVSDSEEIVNAVHEIRKVFWKGGFNCRQFFSNCVEQLKQLPEEWCEMKEEISLLGIKWQAKSDTFRLTLPSYRWASDEQVTKRKLLSLIAGVYDPCGWISPALLGAKNAQEDIWAKHPGSGMFQSHLSY